MPKREPVYLTPKGLERTQEELRYLQNEKRKELSEYMGSAIADGDLRESAAYDEARMLQSENEARIADLEELLNRAVVVDSEEGETTARLGAIVTLKGADKNEVTYHLVGTHEADFLDGKISDESPLGQALLGRSVGDTVTLPMGGKSAKLTVTSVRFE